MNLFKKKEDNAVELTIVDDKKELPDFRKITVPDLKQYLIDGYDEIRKVKLENEDLKEKLEEAKKFKQLYEATLVTLEEFKKRDTENNTKIETLENKIEDRNTNISDLNETINTYRIREYQVEEKLEKIEKIKEETKKEAQKEYKEKIINKVNSLKGNISKSRLFSEIETL